MKKILDEDSLKKALEALLFIAKEPVSLKELAEIVEQKESEVARCLEELGLDYADRGIQLVNLAGGYQLSTRPEVSPYVEKFLKPAVEVHLSTPALETLAIVAYKQPISRHQIEQIRGVDCDSVMKTLLEKRLVKETGRADLPGRPIIYGTTEEFLFHFGLSSLKELPPANLSTPETKMSDFSFIYQRKSIEEEKVEIPEEILSTQKIPPQVMSQAVN